LVNLEDDFQLELTVPGPGLSVQIFNFASVLFVSVLRKMRLR